jgi:hypothetical protein
LVLGCFEIARFAALSIGTCGFEFLILAGTSGELLPEFQAVGAAYSLSQGALPLTKFCAVVDKSSSSK